MVSIFLALFVLFSVCSVNLGRRTDVDNIGVMSMASSVVETGLLAAIMSLIRNSHQAVSEEVIVCFLVTMFWFYGACIISHKLALRKRRRVSKG